MSILSSDHNETTHNKGGTTVVNALKDSARIENIGFQYGALMGAFTPKDGLPFAERLKRVCLRYGAGLSPELAGILERHYTAYKIGATSIGRSEFTDVRSAVRRKLFNNTVVPLGKREAEVIFLGIVLLRMSEDSAERPMFVSKWNSIVQRNYHLTA